MKKLFLVLTMVVMVSMSAMTAEAKTSRYYENMADNMTEEFQEEIDGVLEDEELYYDYFDGCTVTRGEIIHGIVNFKASFEMYDGNIVETILVYDLYEDMELQSYLTLNDERVDDDYIEELYPEICW